MKYSKTKVTLKLESGTYKANKLGAYTLSVEGFKLVSAIAPSLGAGIDGKLNQDSLGLLDGSNTVAAMMQLLSQNITSEHYEELTNMLLGSLVFDGEKIEDWSEHFDEYGEDFLEVMMWLFKENFVDFFMKSTILSKAAKNLKETVLPKVKDMVKNFAEEPSNEDS